MKNIKIKKALYKLLATGATIIVLTTGCSNKENNAEPIETITNENTLENEIQSQEETKEENNFDNFETEKNEANNLIYTGNFEKAEEFWSDTFIGAVDMIFYGKEYKGTTWDELTNEAKKQCINNLTIMDQNITAIYPDYKEDLEKGKNFAATTYLKGLEKIKNTIGQDKYNEIKNIKDSIINKVQEKTPIIKDNITNKAEEWYQNYKNSHTK